MLLVLFAATLAAMGRLASLLRDADVARIACYVALTSNITPLIDAAATDIDMAAAGPECNAPPEVAARIRGANVDRSAAGNAMAVAVPLATRQATARGDASAGTPSPAALR